MAARLITLFFLLFLLPLEAFPLSLYLPYKYPGTVGYFKLDSDLPAKAVLGYRGRKWFFRNLKGSKELYFSIPYFVKGNFTLTLYQGDKRLFFRTFPIWKKKYRISRIWVEERPLKGKLLERVKREAKLLRKVLSEITPKKFKETHLYPPLRRLIVTTPFGARRIINGKRRSIHWGTDFRAPRGTPVYASLSGKVVLARNLYFTGNTVIIDHGLGVHTLYAHLSKIKVKEGQAVRAGQVIGEVGSTGRSTGPHLHFGFYVQGERADPMIVLKERLQ
ncbi:MAG: M23 family metallopeptidase [Desulfurobacteriaceae bacterium]